MCPICGNKLRNRNRKDTYMHSLDKTSNFVQRTCHGTGHFLQLISDGYTKKVDMLIMYLPPTYTRYLEIDFLHKKCRISCMKNGVAEHIDIPKMVYPDFPDLKKLKERIAMYVTFS